MINSTFNIEFEQYHSLFDGEESDLFEELEDLKMQRQKTNIELSNKTHEQQKSHIMKDLRNISRTIKSNKGGTNEGK